MAMTVYDLAIRVILDLVDAQQRAESGQDLSFADTRAELLSRLNEMEQISHGEPGLWEAWKKVRNPLVYLIDEMFILNIEWPYREDWSNSCFEVELLGFPEALRGENFYNECDEGLKELEMAERMQRPDTSTRADVVSVYYVAMQIGFKGRYRGDPDAWREYKGHVFSKLPAYAQTRSRELLPDVNNHTVVIDPNYEPVMRLLYVAIGAGVAIVLYLVGTYAAWDGMTNELVKHARSVAVMSSDAAPAATATPAVTVTPAAPPTPTSGPTNP